MLDSHFSEWLNLLIRWLHIIVGIAWIGASFYFNWLENHLIRTGVQKPGISGYLWAIHGGGIYRLEKFKTAPDIMPDKLHWFKWEAYTTWLTGMALLFAQYYWNASSYLIDHNVMALAPWQAVAIGVIVIIASWIVYHALCNALEHRPVVLSILGLVLLAFAAYALSHLFSGRGAYIHVGAMIGTAMVGNVAMVIMPSQRALLAAVAKGDVPDPKYGAKALLRSRHNNYLTLPILFIMISNHYPSTYGQEWNWLILIALVVISAGVRHYFNIRHKPEKNAWILPLAALALVSLAWVTQPVSRVASVSMPSVDSRPVTAKQLEAQAHAIVAERCSSCHSRQPTSPLFSAPPAGVVFDTPQLINAQAARIYQQSVVQKVMPLGNLTNMTEDERALLGQWFGSF